MAEASEPEVLGTERLCHLVIMSSDPFERSFA